MVPQKKKYLLLMILLNGSMFLFGFLENIKGVSYPLIKTEFGVSYDDQGKMISLLSFGYTFFCVVAGFMLARFGVKRVYMLGFLCTLAGLFSIYFMPGFWTAALALLLVFASFGLFEVSVNGLATQVFTKKTALLMSILHFFYGLGAMVAPKLAGSLTKLDGLGWRHMYLFSIPLALILFVPAALTPFPSVTADNANDPAPTPAAGKAPRQDTEKPVPRVLTFTGALKDPEVWIFGLTLGLMMGVEMVSANWGGLYFQDVYGMDPRTRGADFVSAFFVLFTLSRLASGFLVEKIGYMKSLLGALIFILLIFTAGFVLGASGIYVLPALGFFIAILWPTFMAVAIGRFGTDAPVKTAAVIALGGLVNAAMQLAIGYINRYMGVAYGYRSALVFSLFLLGFLLFIRRKLDKRPEYVV
jgi:fucose permease